MSATAAKQPATGLRRFLSGHRKAVLIVAAIVWGLTLFDLTLLPRVSSSNLPILEPQRLVGVTVAGDATVLTSADPTSPAGPWLLTPAGGDGLEVVGAALPKLPRIEPTKNLQVEFGAPLQTTLKGVSGFPVDVDAWDGASPALFTVSSLSAANPTVDAYSLEPSHRRLLSVRLALPAKVADKREFSVAKWSGTRPDLFVIDRDADRHRPQTKPSPRPWSIRIYSGESGFRRLIEDIEIRSKLSERLSKYDWWPEFAHQRSPKPNLILVTRERKTGSGKTEIHILASGTDYQHFASHAATEGSQSLGLEHRFVFQRGPRSGRVLMTKIEGGELKVRAVPLP